MSGRPTRSDLHVDQLSNELSIAVGLSVKGVARTVFPTLPVSKSSGKIRSWNGADMKRNEFRKRAPGTVAERAGFGATTIAYDCVEYALGHAHPWRTIEDDDLAELDLVSIAILNAKGIIAEDVAWAAEWFTTGKWLGLGIGGVVDGSPSTKWNSANSTPISELRTIIQGVQKGAQIEDRSQIFLVVPRTVMDALSDNSDVRDRIKWTSKDPLTSEMLRSELQIGGVVVPEMVYESAAEGATSSPAWVMDDAVLALHVPPRISKLTPAAGVTATAGVEFMLGHDNLSRMLAAAGAVAIRQYDETDAQQSVYEGAINIDHVQTMASAGVFASNVLA